MIVSPPPLDRLVDSRPPQRTVRRGSHGSTWKRKGERETIVVQENSKRAGVRLGEATNDKTTRRSIASLTSQTIKESIWASCRIFCFSALAQSCIALIISRLPSPFA